MPTKKTKKKLPKKKGPQPGWERALVIELLERLAPESYESYKSKREGFTNEEAALTALATLATNALNIAATHATQYEYSRSREERSEKEATKLRGEVADARQLLCNALGRASGSPAQSAMFLPLEGLCTAVERELKMSHLTIRALQEFLATA